MDRLAAMETFVRVVQTGSFSAAARALNVGQPAVSKIIAQLKARLDERLLMRSTRGLSPTEAGQSFCDRARRAIEADEAELAARGAGTGLTGRLRAERQLWAPSKHHGDDPNLCPRTIRGSQFGGRHPAPEVRWRWCQVTRNTGRATGQNLFVKATSFRPPADPRHACPRG
jgi:hypothetical protein